MDFFGIGMPELMVVLVIAIVMFGPDKIPTMVGQVTKAIRDFRRYTSDLTKEFNEATGGLRDEFSTITNDLKSELAQAQSDLRSQLDLTDVLKMDDIAAPATVAVATTSAETAPLESAVASEPTKYIDDAPTTPEPTITVTTPYADALAASANGAMNGSNGANGANGHADDALALTVPLATKADPLADLTILTLDGTPQMESSVAEPSAEMPSAMPELIAVGAETAPAAFAVSDGSEAAPEAASFVTEVAEPVVAANGTNDVKPRVGGSVAGSKYARRRKA